jgi:peptide/nickel transport system substrate-binding protein
MEEPRIMRQLTLVMLLVIAATNPLRAQTQKGTLIFAVESLSGQTMDPILEARPGTAIYQAPMYDSLVGFNIDKGGIGPGVAERWDLSEDG